MLRVRAVKAMPVKSQKMALQPNCCVLIRKKGIPFHNVCKMSNYSKTNTAPTTDSRVRTRTENVSLLNKQTW